MLLRFCLYGFLKNQRYFEPFFMVALLAQGINFFTIGWLYALRSLTINLLEIPSGALADGFGRRYTMILSFAAYILSFLVFALAPHPAWLALAMVLFGVGDSLRTGTHKAMIFQWLSLRGEQNQRTRIYGVTRSWSKFGSATSAIVAAAIVLWTDDYRSVFWLATLPYVLNIVNLIGYPAELDGDVFQGGFASRLRQVVTNLQSTLRDALQQRPLRRLMVEAMAWDGMFGAFKDYLGPVLLTVFVSSAAASASLTESSVLNLAEQSVAREPSVVIGIAVVYTVLFLASGWASRLSHRFVQQLGGQEPAAAALWKVNLSLFAVLLVIDLFGWLSGVALVFVLLTMLQNVWRPVLISRFDECSRAEQGATVLSIESQSQRLATFVFAPLVGWLVDRAVLGYLPGHYWPIALLGGLAAVAILATQTSRLATPGPKA